MNRNIIQGLSDLSATEEGYNLFPGVVHSLDSPHSSSGSRNHVVQEQVPKAPLLEKPKRPLSGYNLFFQDERVRLLEVLPERPDGKKPRRSHGKLGFKDMATIIGQRWRELDAHTKQHYEDLAKEEKARYRRNRAAYLRQQEILRQKHQEDREQQYVPQQQDLEPIWLDDLSPVRSSDVCSENGICQLASKLDEDAINLIIQAFR